MAERPRVVITGMGTVNPLGLDVATTWENLIAGKSGITSFGEIADRPDPRIAVAGQVKDFDPETYILKKNASRIHRSAQFALAATIEALGDAGLLSGSSREDWKLAKINPDRVGLRIGSGVAGSAYSAEVQKIILDKGQERIPSTSILQMLPERVDTVTSMTLGIKGPGAALVAACATGSESIADAARLIILGEADVVIAGGTEAALDPIGVGSFASMRALSTNENPEEACRPFDQEANGFIMAEGAGVLVLESLDSAKARGAHIYAELAGFADTMDAGASDTAPTGEGAERAMRLCLERAGLGVEDIDYINTHGTSTPVGDPAELKAIKAVFGEAASKILISSTKSATGHLLGAAGGLEAILSIKVIETGIVPPTLNLHNVREEGEGLDLVPLAARQRSVKTVVSNSFGFGGLNSVLTFIQFQG